MVRNAIRTAVRVLRGSPVITLDYPINVQPRYGWGRPHHPELLDLVRRHEPSYQQTLEQMRALEPWLSRIPNQPKGESPHWDNGFFSGVDAAGLYTLLVVRKPARLIEIGSGNSTKFARRAIVDHDLATQITCIDPAPRAEVAGIADTVYRTPLQDADLSVFQSVQPGDFVSLDGSHYAYQNSDTAVFFLEVLPRLPKGVLVHVHDIRIPEDYSTKVRDLWYGEQYVLAAWLLGRGEVEVVWPSLHIWHTPELKAQLPQIVASGGTSFWFLT